jgi:hypothetical protein
VLQWIGLQRAFVNRCLFSSSFVLWSAVAIRRPPTEHHVGGQINTRKIEKPKKKKFDLSNRNEVESSERRSPVGRDNNDNIPVEGICDYGMISFFGWFVFSSVFI